MRDISLLAIVVGAFSDFVLSVVLSSPLDLYVIFTHGLSSLRTVDMLRQLANAYRDMPMLWAPALAIGLICSVLAGCIAAHVAPRRKVLNGSLAALPNLSIGIYILVSEKTAFFALTLGLVVVNPLLYACGAYIRVRTLRVHRVVA